MNADDFFVSITSTVQTERAHDKPVNREAFRRGGCARSGRFRSIFDPYLISNKDRTGALEAREHLKRAQPKALSRKKKEEEDKGNPQRRFTPRSSRCRVPLRESGGRERWRGGRSELPVFINKRRAKFQTACAIDYHRPARVSRAFRTCPRSHIPTTEDCKVIGAR